ncbi:MAG: transcriptional regulator [Micrococcales bacterium]|nr:transcriptional regulator [Micrococcales bacterium]
MAKLVLTAIGDDRRGLVSALSQAVADHGGSWLEGQMARLGGKFAGIVLVDLPDDRVDALHEALRALGEEGLLEVGVTPVETGPAEPEVTSTEPLAVHLLGHDRPGIVREVSAAIAGLGATIDELATSTQDAPMGDGVLFEADAIVRLPEGASAADLRAALEEIAAELMVDLEVAEPV